MRVFVSWSGERSQRAAAAICEWLPMVIQSVKPYMSSEDIDKGARWSSEIAAELEQAKFGIICVTQENLDAQWLNFEAGALSTSYGKGKVAPLLIGVPTSSLRGPLVQFQATSYDRADVLRLVKSVNDSCEESSLDGTMIENVFNTWWPQLEKKLDAIVGEESDEATEPKRSTEDILVEILNVVRSQQRLLSSPSDLVPREYLRSMLKSDISARRGHLVYRDLARRWREVELAAVGSSDSDDSLIDAIGGLRKPLEYVIRRFGNPNDLDVTEDLLLGEFEGGS